MSEHPVQDLLNQAHNQWDQAKGHLQAQMKQFPALGQAIESHGKTLIPVIKSPTWLERFKGRRSGKPLGFLEISENTTRYIKVKDKRWLWLGLGLAVLAVVIAIASIGLSKSNKPRRKPSLW